MSRRPFVLFWAEYVWAGVRMCAAAEVRQAGDACAESNKMCRSEGKYNTGRRYRRGEREGGWMRRWMDGWTVQSWVVQRM